MIKFNNLPSLYINRFYTSTRLTVCFYHKIYALVRVIGTSWNRHKKVISQPTFAVVAIAG